MTATFAIVDDSRQVVKQGLISHWALSAYMAELWAVLWACITASTCVHIYTDCWSVAKNITSICSGGTIDPNWRCAEWWRTFSRVLDQRLQHCSQPFQVT